MKVACPYCRHEFKEAYHRIGTPTHCNSCDVSFLLNAKQVVDRGYTGYQITFEDFRNLLREPMSAEEVGRYVITPLRSHVEFAQIQGARDSSEGWVFFSSDLKRWFDPVALHLAIQAADASQQQIYRHAMSQWR